MSSVKVATICLNSTPDLEQNLSKAEGLVLEAASQGAAWIVLPEVFPFIGPDSDTFKVYSDNHQRIFERMQVLAEEHSVTLFAGTIPEPCEKNEKLRNRFSVFDRNGDQIASYDKTHLFELRSPDGDIKVTEKKIYSEGSNFKNCQIDGWNVALAVCYDIRFLSFFQSAAKENPFDAIILPSAFTYETGRAHWELLLRARAIDLQCYVVGSAQTGVHFNKRKSFGHAMVVDPWAGVVSNTGEKEGVAYATLKKSEIEASRSRLQQVANRRDDLYKYL